MKTLPIPVPDVEITSVITAPGHVEIEAQSQQQTARCPDCQRLSSSVHSHYTRRPQDLSCFGQTTHLKLTVARFRCRNPDCPRQTFVERLPQLVSFYARCTSRLVTVLRSIAFEVGAETSARLLNHLGIMTSGDTLLRLMRRTTLTRGPEPRVVGLDDWAFKKGLRYGTILVDLERHCPIDLLPDRQVQTVKMWLAQHPGIEIVARDRSQDYARAITAAAPQAIQIADRWHLLQNLTQALKKVLDKYAPQLRQWTKDVPHDQRIIETDNVSPPSSTLSDIQQKRHHARQQRFQQVHHLHQLGWQQQTIAHHVGLCPRTVSRYLTKDALPPIRRQGRQSKLDAHRAYVLQRWNDGCHNARQLGDEIRSRGYTGGMSVLRDYVARLRQIQLSINEMSSETTIPATFAARSLTPTQVAFWLLYPLKEDQNDHATLLTQFHELFPDLQTIVDLFQAFATIVREKQVEQFDLWLQTAITSDCKPLQQFARGIQRDEAAVRAALLFDWSNGQSEGQINRLKFLKRQMYGRAKFDLLRLRVLYPM